MKLALASVLSLFWLAALPSASVTAADSAQGSRVARSDPYSLVEYNNIAEAFLDLGLMSECDYAKAIVGFAYPNKSSRTGWDVPSANEDSEYAEVFYQAAGVIDNVYSIIDKNKCVLPANGKCCNHGPLADSCDKKDNKQCTLHPQSGVCTSPNDLC